jgi:ABC-type transport system involved in multi-copper enzyme maturation permease subunit
MWALIYKELMQMRNYILQVGLGIITALLLFGRSLEGFLVPYLSILPMVMAFTVPQCLFSMEERGNTLVFLRSLPIRPRQIVAGKFVVAALLVAFLVLLGLSYSFSLGQLEAALARVGPNLIISAFLLGISLLLHFRLGAKSAKIALLITLMLLALVGMAVMQNQQLMESVRYWPVMQSLLDVFNSWLGALLGLVVAALVLAVFYEASASVFTGQDISRMP